MKIALIDTYGAWTHSSLALQYLAGYALQDAEVAGKAEIKTFSLNHSRLARGFQTTAASCRDLDPILAFAPDLVGLSCYVWNFWELIQIATWLKAHLPFTVILLGGPEIGSPTLAGRILSEISQVSFLILGEGEIPFRQLLRYLLLGQGHLKGISGLAFRSPQGEEFCGPPGEGVQDLDELPSPILEGKFSTQSECILWETYRGCPNRCRYCTWSHQKHRRFPLPRLFAELDVLLGCGISQLYVVDPWFGPDRERAERLLDHLLQRWQEGLGLPGLFVFPDSRDLDLNYARKLKDANCTVSFGLQSTNPRALALARRRHDLPALAQALGLANKHFPRYDVDLIYGLPGDDYGDVLTSFNWLAGRHPPEIHCHRLTVLPGSVFAEEAGAYGLTFQEWPPHDLLATQTLAAADLGKLEKFAAGVHLLYNHAPLTFRCLGEVTGVAGADLIRDFLAWLDGIGGWDNPEAEEAGSPPKTFALLRRFIIAQLPGLDDQDQMLLLAALAYDQTSFQRWKGSYCQPRCDPSRGSDSGLVEPSATWEGARTQLDGHPDAMASSQSAPVHGALNWLYPESDRHWDNSGKPRPGPQLVELALKTLRRKIEFPPGRELLDLMAPLDLPMPRNK